MAKVIATVDFGADQTDRGDFTVTDASFAGLTYAEAWFMSSDSTTDNNPVSHEMAAVLIELSCDAPVGNDIGVHAYVMNGTIAKTMKIRVGAN